MLKQNAPRPDCPTEQRILWLIQDLEKKLDLLGSVGWLDIHSLAGELASYLESGLNVCQEYLNHRDFASL